MSDVITLRLNGVWRIAIARRLITPLSWACKFGLISEDRCVKAVEGLAVWAVGRIKLDVV